jgi:Zn-dependent protease with chaperone function/uncharacterized tellurite resistance protein B-like protein
VSGQTEVTNTARKFQVRREKALRDEVDSDFGVKKSLERIEELTSGKGYGYRRSLVSRALRLTRSMSPEIADTIAQCKAVLGYEEPVEVYVRPEPVFNASCYKEQHGPTVIVLSSRLLEVFTPAELRFVIGHELGHAALDHFGLPMPITAALQEMGVPFVSRPMAIKLYAWCRAAELSADRIGLVCAQDPEAAASGFFKLASGMASERVRPDLTSFARQIESLAAAPEAREAPRDDDDTLDCFSTHPYNPVRVRAVWAFGRSSPYLDAVGYTMEQPLTIEQVESLVERDLDLMEPIYLQEKSSTADTLRRLLFTAGIAVANAFNGVEDSELDALSKLLGPDYRDAPDNPETIVADLDDRIEAAKECSLAQRAQLISHLTIVAAADGEVQGEELRIMESIAHKLGVNPKIIHYTIQGAMHPID